MPTAATMQNNNNKNNSDAVFDNIEKANFVSTNLSHMEYDNAKRTLRITFNADGSTYEYYNVPSIVVYELQAAASAGSYFHKFIRDRYNYKRI